MLILQRSSEIKENNKISLSKQSYILLIFRALNMVIDHYIQEKRHIGINHITLNLS
jgi:hypothetical protein